MNKDKYLEIFNEFEIILPSLSRHCVDYCPSGRNEITIKLDDGSKIAYDHVTKTFRNLPLFTDENRYSDENIWRKEFGIRLNNAIRNRGITKSKLSELSGISKVMISKYINGKSSPSVFNLNKMAYILECSPSELTDF